MELPYQHARRYEIYTRANPNFARREDYLEWTLYLASTSEEEIQKALNVLRAQPGHAKENGLPITIAVFEWVAQRSTRFAL